MNITYINIVANNSVGVINRISNLLRKRNYNIDDFSAAFDEKGFGHIIVGIKLKDTETPSQIIAQLDKLYDVKDVTDMSLMLDKVQFLFNVNCNCKKTLKNISEKPDKIIETPKELIYTFIISLDKKQEFLQQLTNLKLPYVQRILGLTD